MSRPRRDEEPGEADGTIPTGAAPELGEAVVAALSALELDGARARVVEPLGPEVRREVGAVLEFLGGVRRPDGSGGSGGPGGLDGDDDAYVFPEDARDLVDRAIDAGRLDLPRAVRDAALSGAATPAGLAAELVAAAGVVPRCEVLEPSAGDGAIVRALQGAGAIVTAVELSPVRRETLLLRVLSPRDLLAREEDFLQYRPPSSFDRVVMRPPSCRSGLGDHLDHVRHAYDLLRPRGILVAVLPASLAYRRDPRHVQFRRWCGERGAVQVAARRGSSQEDLPVVVVRLERPAASATRPRGSIASTRHAPHAPPWSGIQVEARERYADRDDRDDEISTPRRRGGDWMTTTPVIPVTKIRKTSAERDQKVGQSLTERERAVLWLVADGLSSRAIGERLGFSEHTAKFHVIHVLEKMGTQSRTKAAVDFVLGQDPAALARIEPASSRTEFAARRAELLRSGVTPRAATWRRDAPPRGVRCLVTVLGMAGAPFVAVASASPDFDDVVWFGDGKRFHRVVAWMPAPEAAAVAVAGAVLGEDEIVDRP